MNNKVIIVVVVLVIVLVGIAMYMSSQAASRDRALQLQIAQGGGGGEGGQDTSTLGGIAAIINALNLDFSKKNDGNPSFGDDDLEGDMFNDF